MRRFLILWHIILFPLLAIGQNCGITDTIFIRPNRTITYKFTVTDVVNDNLANPAQGICGIEIEFLHQFSEDMELWVTSPAGQQIQLIGPNTPDPLAFTFGARWDITFVRCAATARPDSGYVAKWDNNQPRNFVSGGRYTGSYYPYRGCLEDFNTGPINGEWTITVRNNPSVYQGAIVNFRLRLCDERGFLCCFADAGSLASYADVNACQGDASLRLNIPPVYAGSPPDTSEYAYTYIISRNDTIVAYDSLADLRGLPPGNYSVCGLSYKTTDRDSFPPPGSSILFSQLRSDLNNNQLLYCGKVTNNCVDVVITAPPAVRVLQESICRGNVFRVGNQIFDATGNYTITLPQANGCDSTIQLRLTVFDPIINNLTRTICAGDSVVVGASVYRTSGNYTNILTAANGCDSTVNLVLTVLNRIETNIAAAICEGGAYTVGNQNFTTSGAYQVRLISALGCDSIVNLNLSVLAPQAIIATTGNLDCENTSVTLNGGGSTPVGSLLFQWRNAGGVVLGTTPSIQTNSPGNYILEATQSLLGVTCSARDSVTVMQTNQNAPTAVIAVPGVLGCNTSQVTLDATASGVSAGRAWRWTGPGIVNGADTPQPVVNEPGVYQLIVFSANGLCTDTATVQVNRDLNAPVANAGNGDTIDCNNSTVTLGGGNTSTGPGITYRWLTQGGSIIGANNTRTITADAPGVYTLIVTDTLTGCADTALTTVALDRTPPVADAGRASTITCGAPDAVLDGSNSAQSPNIRYRWTNATGAVIGNSPIAFATQPGRYFLEVLNIANGCSARDSVEVTIEQGVPNITFGDALILCDSNALTLTATVSPIAGNYSYNWRGAGIQSPNNQLAVRVNTPGEYIFSVRNLDNDCVVTDTVTVVRQNCDICLQITAPDTLTCIKDNITLEALFCAACNDCTISWTTLDGRILSGSDSLRPVINAPGTYTVTATNSTRFSRSLSVTVAQNIALPNADAGADAVITCAQPRVTLGGSNTSNTNGYAQIWRSRSGEPISPNNRPTIMVNYPDTFYLEVLNTMTGCIAVDSVVVTIDTLSPIAITGAPVTLTCSAPTATLNGAGSSVGVNIAYEWTTASGNIVTGGNTLAPIVNSAGTYLLTVRNTQNGCVATDSLVVTADELPVIPALRDTALTCNEPSISITAPFNANGNFRLRWCALDVNGNPTNCTDGLTFTANTPGRYQFEVVNTDNGCAATRTLTVQNNQIPPGVNAGRADTLTCNINSQTLNASVTPATGNYRYRWTARSGAPITNDTTLSPTITRPDVYILAVTNLANGCTASDSLEVLQNTETPVVFAGSDTTALTCAVTTFRFNPRSIGNNLRYQWTTPNGNIVSGADTPTAEINRPGAYILAVTNTVTGCSIADTVIIRQDVASPTAVISNSDQLALNCINNRVTLDASSSLSASGAALTFQWRALGSAQIIGNSAQPTVQTATGGEFEIQVTDTRNGCTNTRLVNVSADYKKPELVVTPPLPLTCSQTATVIDAGRSATLGGFTARWTLPNGLALPDTGLVITANTAGNYRLLLTNRGNGCSDSITINVPINTEPPAVRIAPPRGLDCEITSTQLTATATGGSGFTYRWSTQTGVIAGGQNAPTVTVNKAGRYTVEVTRADNGCTSTAEVEVQALETPIEQGFYTVIKPNCDERASATVTIDSVRGGAAPYLYSFFESPFTPVPAFENLPTGTYNLVIQDRNGCEWRTKVVIPPPDTIKLSLSPDVEIKFGSSAQLVATLNPPAFRSIIWEPDSTKDTSSLVRIVTPLQSTLYRVTVTGINGCKATATVMVFVDETVALFAPNVFTPNGDGVNDVFMLFAGQTVTRIKNFMIFDRWGDRIYQAGPFQPNDPNFGWDGTYQGKPMDPGVFVFWAEVELLGGRTELVKGDVTLLR